MKTYKDKKTGLIYKVATDTSHFDKSEDYEEVKLAEINTEANTKPKDKTSKTETENKSSNEE